MMEVSVVRQRVREVLQHSKRTADERRADRRAQTDAAAHEYPLFLERVAVPLFKQVANVLRAEGRAFDVFTPGNTGLMIAGRGNDDYLELPLDTGCAAPE